MNSITDKKQMADELYKAAPALYRGKDIISEGNSIPLFWGFECGVGWYNLLLDLSKKMEAILVTLPEDQRPLVTQIKEKFGALRFHINPSSGNLEADKAIDRAVNEAEERSRVTCERCGKPGTIVENENQWLTCLCPECLKEGRKKE